MDKQSLSEKTSSNETIKNKPFPKQENRLDLLPYEVFLHIYLFVDKSELLICIGGREYEQSEYLDKTEWKPLRALSIEPFCANPVGIDYVIYIVGGYVIVGGRSVPLAKMKSFDLKSASWSSEPDMNTARSRCATAVVQLGNVQTILVSGGYNRKDGYL